MDVIVRDDIVPEDPRTLARVVAVMRQSLDRYEPPWLRRSPSCDHPTTLERDDPVPEPFFFELSTARLLAMLEGAGLTRDAVPPLPSARDMFANLRNRLCNPESCWTSTIAEMKALFNRVCQLWVAYDWTQFEGASMAVLKEVDDLAALAEFLWNTRDLSGTSNDA